MGAGELRGDTGSRSMERPETASLLGLTRNPETCSGVRPVEGMCILLGASLCAEGFVVEEVDL